MKIIKSIIYFCFAFLLIGLFFEIFLHTAGILSPVMKIDSRKGERFYPNITINSLFMNEGFGLSKTNSLGWLGKNPIDRIDTDISIAVIGNSFVASQQVFTRNKFLAVAEDHVNKELSDFNTSFYNFGKKQVQLGEILFIKKEVAKEYNPEHIIVFLNERNFVIKKSSRMVPYYEYKDDQLVLNSSYNKSSTFRLYNKLGFLSNSSLIFLGYRVKNKLRNAPKILFDKLYPTGESEDNDVKGQTISISPTDKRIIEELSMDDRVIFLLDLSTENASQIRSLVDQSPIINFNKPLMAMKNNEVDPYYWKVSKIEGHWNNKAHKIIGKELGENMINIIKLDNSSNK